MYKKSSLGKTMPMLTKTNFFDSVTPDSINEAPQALKEAYELAVSLKNDGINPFSSGDADIDETMQMMLDKLNSFYASKNSIVKHDNNSRHESKATKTRGAKGNKAETPKKVAQRAKTSKPKVAKAATSSKPKSKAVVSTHKSVAKTKKVSKPVKVKLVKVKEPKAPVTVKKLSKELQLIKSFCAMNGKRYKADFIDSKYKQFFNFLPESVDHKSTIEEVWKRLGKAVKVIKSNQLAEITLNIDSDFIAKCTDIVKNAKVRIRTEFLSGVKNEVGEFMYRDGANFKTLFFNKIPTGLKLKPGQEVEIEKLGWDFDSFFVDVVGNEYDEEYDHNIVEFVRYVSAKEAKNEFVHLNGTAPKGEWSKKIVDAVTHVADLREADKQVEAQRYYAKLSAKEKQDFWKQFQVVNHYDTDGIPMNKIVAEWKQWLTVKKPKRTTK